MLNHLGDNYSTNRVLCQGDKALDKSMGGSRVSDEAVVSDDPMGQHNPLASQGPLDWSAVGDIEGSTA